MESRNKFREKFLDYLRVEISIEYKSCLYFACILAFYFVYLLIQKTYSASILYMFEMVMAAYVMSYIQVYLFSDTDGIDRPGMKGGLGIAVCTCLYGICSFGLGWFDKKPLATILFSGYLLFCYLCAYLLNRVKRALDTEHLNRMLSEFKERAGTEEEEELW